MLMSYSSCIMSYYRSVVFMYEPSWLAAHTVRPRQNTGNSLVDAMCQLGPQYQLGFIIRTVLFMVIMQQVEVIYYQCFKTTNWSHLQGSRIQKKAVCPNTETRMKEQHRHIWLGHPDKSAVAEHRFNHNHLIKFQDTRILSTVPGYMDLSGWWLSWSFT
jgi:hypothetical protein